MEAGSLWSRKFGGDRVLCCKTSLNFKNAKEGLCDSPVLLVHATASWAD